MYRKARSLRRGAKIATPLARVNFAPPSDRRGSTNGARRVSTLHADAKGRFVFLPRTASFTGNASHPFVRLIYRLLSREQHGEELFEQHRRATQTNARDDIPRAACIVAAHMQHCVHSRHTRRARTSRTAPFGAPWRDKQRSTRGAHKYFICLRCDAKAEGDGDRREVHLSFWGSNWQCTFEMRSHAIAMACA